MSLSELDQLRKQNAILKEEKAELMAAIESEFHGKWPIPESPLRSILDKIILSRVKS